METGITYREWLDKKIFHAMMDDLPVPAAVEMEYRGRYGEAAFFFSVHQARIDAGLFVPYSDTQR